MPALNPGDLFRPHGHPARRLAGEPPETRGGSYWVVLSTAARSAATASHKAPCSGMPRRGSPEEGIRVVALSLDETSTRRFISRHGSTFPVDPSADGPHVRELTGAFVNPDPESIQETGFVLPPDGRVVVSVYFSGVIATHARGGYGAGPTYTRRSRLIAGRSALPTPIRILSTRTFLSSSARHCTRKENHNEKDSVEETVAARGHRPPRGLNGRSQHPDVCPRY